MFLKLRTVVYNVADLDAAKSWYTELLGFSPYFAEPFYVGFDVNGCELGLNPDMTDVVAGGGTHAYWQVENIDEAHARLLTMGAASQSPVQDVGGGIKVAAVRDPWGNVVGIIQG